MGLSFVNKGSNMAAIILSSLQNLKWLKVGYKYIKQPLKLINTPYFANSNVVTYGPPYFELKFVLIAVILLKSRKV